MIHSFGVGYIPLRRLRIIAPLRLRAIALLLLLKEKTLSKRSKKSKFHKFNVQSLPEHLRHINLNAAGIDIGSERHMVAVPEGRDEVSVREFGAFTADLQALADWLQQCGVTTVAMESTGVYWIPLCELLDRRGFEVKLVDARQVKNVSGRKSDVLDCQWIQQLHTYGLLAGAFRPADELCVLRSYLRQREMLTQSSSMHIQHMQKALQQMNLLLHNVVSDITGVTGMKIIKAILAGERDPRSLARNRDGRCQNTSATIAKSLVGNYREEHLFALKQAVDLYETYQTKIADCDEAIVKHVTSWLGLCPGTKISGGKVLDKKTKRNPNRATQAFRMAAATQARSKTALGAFYRRIKSRTGGKQAVTATAHKIARIYYTLLTKGTSYVELGQQAYEQKYKQRRIHHLMTQAKSFGFQLVPCAT